MSAGPVPSMTPQQLQQMLDEPAMPPPPGVIPNFQHPDSLQTLIRASAGFGLTIATLATIARTYTKAVLLRKMHWEDYTTIVSWAFYMGFIAACLKATPWVGIHMWDQPGREVPTLLKYANTAEIAYNPAIAFVKITILLQYMRIFVPSRRQNPVMFGAIHAVLWTTMAMYFIIMFLQIFSCNPREKQWNQTMPGTCFDVLAILVGSAAFNLVSDIIVLIMPQYSIWRLQMSGKRKAGVSAIFGLGGVAIVITALRVQSTAQVRGSMDISWYLAPCAIWAILEVALGIVCTALPVMPKPFQTLDRTISDKWSSYGRSFCSKYSRSVAQRSMAVGYPIDKARIGRPWQPPYYEPPHYEPPYYEPRPETPAETWYDDATDGSVSEVSSEIAKPLPALPRDRDRDRELEAQRSQIIRTVQIEIEEARIAGSSDRKYLNNSF